MEANVLIIFRGPCQSQTLNLPNFALKDGNISYVSHIHTNKAFNSIACGALLGDRYLAALN